MEPPIRSVPTKTTEFNDAVRLGQKLVSIRKSNSMTQSELAAAVGCTPANIHNYEKGIYRPPHDVLDAIRVATKTEGIPLTDSEVVTYKMEQYAWNRTTDYNDIGIEQVEEKVRELARCEESCYDADLEIFCTLFTAIS